MKISLITVSYNSATTIQTTLDSVVKQNYPDLEYIIVDGGSVDRIFEIVGCYPDLITQFISEPDKGIYDAMNKGIKHSTGEVIGILNSDDFYLSNKVLHEVESLFAKDSKLDVVLGDVDFVENDDLCRPVRKFKAGSFKPWMFRFGLMPPHPAVFVRKTAYDRIGLYKLGYRIAADFDLMTRLLLLDGAKYQLTNKTWVRMRTGGASTSGLKSVIIITQEMKRSLQDNGIFASGLLLLLRLPFKWITQVLSK